ncbi:F0F1 ATP synthase subunit B [Cocleimonas flava]|jgi:F-type H+-transporting ATPase subunit b|uniref:ATP synthase subunit b n=1 Tax=Cocleimonas flava TaxID=634765 RepID=A0A4R1ESU4_9GAMM|nr:MULTISPECIES: F0F1 ATP synthase subunit B [Cocleimonas]MEB8432409.1 F0F1 ATP synthase subunit B [Cocleimonas sp. KMM 6892]MEC4715268.1 F0F1 ATP synthase subunit B [Cocleimonas sp. KMM 6895]MEC4745113.1 F0F1 ATP synthase subunit B [Cocleimonas sp. KMM 6896]TCJ82844.1 F-type H+-transporting ATPase subunit b [Cocleimonas flava]
MNVTATLIGQLIVFSILIWFIKAVLWEPVINTLEDRKKRIADGLAASEKGMKDQELAAENAKQAIKEAKQEAAEIIAQAKARDTQMIEEAKNKAVEEADRVIAGAQAEIDQEVNRAKDSLRTQVSSLAVAGASKILGKEVDANAHKAALKELIEQI